MRRVGTILLIAAAVAAAVGLLGLASLLARRQGVEFVFDVRPWYGPLLGAAVLAGVGWLLRRGAAGARPRAVS